MITVKGSRLRMLVLCVAAFLLLSGCGAEGEEPIPDFEPLLSDTAEESDSSQSFAWDFYLILPADSSDAFVERARELGEAIRARTGIGWRIFTDDMRLPPDSDVFEIVLGWADHPQRRLWGEKVREKDYFCAVSSRTMVLCGRTEETALLAIERFQTAVLPYADLSLLNGMVFYQNGQYEKNEVSLNGVALGEWSLVCDSEDPWVWKCAEALREEIRVTSGYLLPLRTTVESDSVSLILRKGEDPLHAAVTASREGLILSASDRPGMERAMLYLTQILFLDGDGDGICHESISTDRLLLVSPARFQVCGWIGDGTLPTDTHPFTLLGEQLVAENPDTVFAWNLSADAKEYLRKLLFRFSLEEGENGLLGIREGMSSERKWELCSEKILSVTWIGEPHNGFWWVVCRSGADLPREIIESLSPVFVLTCDGEEGTLGNTGALSLNESFVQRVQVGERDYVVKGYTTDSVRVSYRVEESALALLSFEVERIG